MDTKVALLTSDVDCGRLSRRSRVETIATRVADRFVRFGRGEATAPRRHTSEVALLLGNQPVGRVPFAQAVDRRQWRGCPDPGYAAASCPVDFLAPVIGADVSRTRLDYTPTAPEGVCLVKVPTDAHATLLAQARVVISPTRSGAACSNDFQYELFLDERGVLVAVNLVLSDP